MRNKEKDILNFKLWFILFMILNLIFSYYYMTFFWGDHDWDWIKGTSQVLGLATGMFEGRYAKFILNVMLFNGHIFPIINNFVAFSLLALGGVLLTKYWQIKGQNERIIIALTAILSPFILGWLYFPINILGNFAAVALIVGGLLLSEKERTWQKVMAIICFLLALGVYPSMAEMLIICFCFRYIIQKTTSAKEIVLNAVIPLFGLICFKLLLMFLAYKKWIVGDYYNLQTLTMVEMFKNIPQTVRLAFSQLITTIPFVTVVQKILGLIIIIFAILSNSLKLKNLILWIIAFLATVFSSALTAAPEETAYMPRVNFYGLNFLYVGAIAILLTRKQWLKNIGIVLSFVLLWNYIIADINAQKNWNFGKKAEEQLVERISTRIAEKNTNNIFIPVVAGELPLRPRYYADKYQKESPYILNRPLMVRHIPSGMFNFYAPAPIFYGNSQIASISSDLYEFLATASAPWPKDGSLFTDDTYAIILLTAEGIRAIQAQLPH